MNPIDLLNYHLDNTPLAVVQWDAQFRVKRWSNMAENIFGWKEVEVASFHPFAWDFVYQDDIQRVSEVMDDLLGKKVTRNISFNRNYTKDGRVVYCEWYNSILFDEEGKLLSVLSLVLDVTKNVELAETISLKQPIANTGLDVLKDAYIITNINYRVTYLNYQASKLTGFTNKNAKGCQLDEVFRLRNKSIQNIIETSKPINNLLSFGYDYWLTCTQQQTYQVEFIVIGLYTNNQVLKGYLLIFNNLQRNNSLISQFKYQVERDQVTGLYNRSFFLQELDKAIASVKNSNISHCFCYLDLDRFQIINNTCGHIAGDQLLQQLSQILLQELGHHAIIARLGGDEFGILLLYYDVETAQNLIRQIRDKIKNFNFIYSETIFRISASFGLIEINQNSSDSILILSAADAACLAAKEKGRNKIQVYQNSDLVLTTMRSDRQWTIRVNQAIKEQRFCLYQQKIETAKYQSKQPQIAEILVRMIGEDGRIITPLNFIPAAERYGLMTDIDCLVIKMLEEYSRNEQTNNYYLINLSATTIGEEIFLSFLEDIFTNQYLKPESICFEITETAAINNIQQAIKFIKKLKNLGCQFALDDFGTGMSSFSYLKKLPIDYIKIDGSFIKNINNELNYIIVESIVKIAQLLEVKTVAEWVENDQIRDQVAAMGVDYVQGYGVESVNPLTFS
ncbi:MAG: EAL domain-containing protein [Gloeocapsa sp. DLM2.Bin57]|nr:MAG: EAL domain-containing protein [Gloeocapsa sp. DLM2.Bin57]